MHYQCYTTGKNTQNTVTLVCGSHWNTSITFVAYFTIYSPYTIDSIHVWKSVSIFHRNQGNVVYPFRKKKGGNQEVNSSGFLMSFPRNTTMTRLICVPQSNLHFYTHNRQNISNKKIFFQQKLPFVCAKPSVPCEETSWLVFDFGVLVFK